MESRCSKGEWTSQRKPISVKDKASSSCGDAKDRMVIDYRALNEATLSNPPCLPRLQDLLRECGPNTAVFSKIDLTQSTPHVKCVHCAQAALHSCLATTRNDPTPRASTPIAETTVPPAVPSLPASHRTTTPENKKDSSPAVKTSVLTRRPAIPLERFSLVYLYS